MGSIFSENGGKEPKPRDWSSELYQSCWYSRKSDKEKVYMPLDMAGCLKKAWFSLLRCKAVKNFVHLQSTVNKRMQAVNMEILEFDVEYEMWKKLEMRILEL